MFRRIERVYIVFTLMLLAGALAPSNSSELGKGSVSNEGNDFFNLLLRADLGFLLVFAAIRFRTMSSCLRAAIWPVALAALALVSTAWSTNPDVTLKKALIFSGITLFGMYLGSCFEPDEQISLIGWFLTCSVIGSLLVVAVFPDYGISHDIHMGAWKGLFEHKNGLGAAMVFAVLTFGITSLSRASRAVKLGSLAGSVILLAFSRSATAVAVLAVLIVIALLLPSLRSRNKTAAAAILLLPPLILLSVFLAYQGMPLVLKYLGRDATLTGRTYIWQAVLKSISERPWLGFGYQAYFSRFAGDSMIVVAMTGGFNPAHSHNGYLDLFLDLGVAGFTLFIGGLAVGFTRAIRFFRLTETAEAKWFVLFLFFFVLSNLTESYILRPLTPLYIPYVASLVSLGRLSRRKTRSPKIFIETPASSRFGQVATPLATTRARR